MDRKCVQKRRNHKYRRMSGGAELNASLVYPVGYKSYTHVLGVIWVAVGSAKN